MAIPESQLDTWSRQGSITQSSTTYQTIRTALDAPDSGYSDKTFEVFLQGSYGNDTNIYAESDVDVVIRLDSTFRYETDQVTAPANKAVISSQISPATYNIEAFRAAVLAHLQGYFGRGAVTSGNKAIKIKGNGSRRDADVVVCQEYRRYKQFGSGTPQYDSGIAFPTPSGEVINYPKQHSANLTAQHQATGGMLKPMVRILKNMRSRMVENGLLPDGVAPSYYIEGMFYNVPREQYSSSSFGETFCNGFNWLRAAERSKLVCANWQYYLLGNSNVQWTSTNFDQFLNSLLTLWNGW